MFIFKDVVNYYQHFYSHFYGNREYIFNTTPKSQKLIETFLDFYQKKSKGKTILGSNFLWKYFIFQFNYWDGIEIEEKNFSNRIVPAYILGLKAIERFEQRNQEFDWAIENTELVEKYKIPKVQLNQTLKPIKDYNEKAIKQLNHGTDRGFNNCLVFTTLYNHREPLCLTCIFKDNCKKVLRGTYPSLYKKRGYRE